MDASALIVIGVELTLLGILLVVFGRRIARRFPKSSPVVVLGRTLAVVLGVGVVAVAMGAGGITPMSAVANPVPNTVVNIETGGRLYQANCAACHGVTARGGGPLSDTTVVAPPSLIQHVGHHTEGDFHYWIAEGLPGGMPAWRDSLSETEIWQIILYIQDLAAR